jgi:hypothetical protein
MLRYDNYRDNRKWSDQYLPSVIKLCGYLFAERIFTISTPDEDMMRCSDLTWLKASDLELPSIAVRIRRPRFWEKYPFDFTLRARLSNGFKTEFEKIVVDGYGDILIYAHADSSVNRKLAHYWIIDLNLFRHYVNDGNIPKPKEIGNGDGTYFYPFDVRHMPSGVVMCGSDMDAAEYDIPVMTRPINFFKPCSMSL